MAKLHLSLASLIALATACPPPALANAEPIRDQDAPSAASNATGPRIDYSYWDTALKYFVFRMGRSDLRAAPRVEPRTGSRYVYGHESRLRLEGNRVAFSLLKPDQIAALSAYKQDLERIGSEVDLAALPRNEQLAFWINLHNVAVIEQIAQAYPVKLPSRMKIGAGRSSLDEARTITIGGVALSPNDIRTRIVYPNWKDPKVLYGFYRGEIGGPSIQREAFTGENVAELLTESASEFVNSLRGMERRGNTLYVSTIYSEAAPFYFADLQPDLKAHLRSLAGSDLHGEIDATSRLEPSIYDSAIADLANGEVDPELLLVGKDHQIGSGSQGSIPVAAPEGRPDIGIPRNVSRIAHERNVKIERMIRRGQVVGKVTVIDMEALKGKEVE